MVKSTLHRIKEYIDFKKLSVRAFEQRIGVSNGSFASQLKNNKSIGVDKLENILHEFPDVNPSWLLTGKGEMLLTEVNLVNEDQDVYKKEVTTTNETGYLKEVNLLLKDKNKLLTDKIEYLEHLLSAAKSRDVEATKQFKQGSFWLSEEKEKKK